MGSFMNAPASPFDLDLEALRILLGAQPEYRARQVWRALHAGRGPSEMTDLPGPVRTALAAALPVGLQEVTRSVADDGHTVKWLWSLRGGAQIETVLMHYPDRSTVCVSSQAGCAMACQFCATGQAGFDRQLSSGEIIEQVVAAQREAAVGGRRVTNVVFMGMGEPLANYDRLWGAIRRLHDDLGISARHLTVSTVGVVPGIRRMAGEDLPVNLAVSLHAANDTLRDRLVPLNRRYPLTVLMEACTTYLAAKGRRLSFEWAVIDGVNDTGRDATELAALARPLGAHVNLIPLNPTPGGLAGGLGASPAAQVQQAPTQPGGQHHHPPQPGNRHRCRVRAAGGPHPANRPPGARLNPCPPSGLTVPSPRP
jgi:23S rRNA (adenine2503-C2)-methyltransferase